MRLRRDDERERDDVVDEAEERERRRIGENARRRQAR